MWYFECISIVIKTCLYNVFAANISNIIIVCDKQHV